MDINTWSEKPIRFDFPELDQNELELIKSKSNVTEFKSHDQLRIQNAYFQRGLPGTSAKAYARQALVDKIEELLTELPHIGVNIFDAYRSIKTQEALYLEFKAIVAQQNPEWDGEAIEKRTLEFVSHPHDTSRFAVPLHNSGAAIDLELYDIHSGQAWDFGTEIDAITDLSHTDFFEQAYQALPGFGEERWMTVRQNRRILYHAMCSLGFINFPNEWWHYDLGDCLWAKVYRCDPIFDSMEAELT